MRILHIRTRISQQLSLSNLIFQAIESFNRIATTEITTRLINARVAALNENWEKFATIHDAIMIAIGHLNTDEAELLREDAYFVDNVHARTYDRYLDSIDKMNAHLKPESLTIPRTSSTQSLSQPASQPPSVSHHTRLPRINLPKFNGTASE